MKRLFLAWQILKNNIVRGLVIFSLAVALLWNVIYISSVANAFIIYEKAYSSMWGGGNRYELIMFSSDIAAPEVKKNINSFDSIEGCYLCYFLFNTTKYKDIPVNLVLVDDGIWKRSESILWNCFFTDDGLTSGVPQIIVCDSQGLFNTETIRIQINEIELDVKRIAEFNKPFLFPNFNIGGLNVSVFERFDKGTTSVVMKLSDSTLGMVSEICPGGYSEIAYVDVKTEASNDDIAAIKEFCDEHNIVFNKIEWSADNRVELRKSILDSYFQLAIWMFFILFAAIITYFAFFFKRNEAELSIVRITSCSKRQCIELCIFSTMMPLFAADIVGVILFLIFNMLGYVPMFSYTNTIFSFSMFFAFSFALNLIFLLVSLTVLLSIIRRGNLAEIKRRVFI